MKSRDTHWGCLRISATLEAVIRIDENCVHTVAGVEVAAANPCVADYDHSAGVANGPSMLLCLLEDDSKVRVGPNSTVELGGERFLVTRVELAAVGESYLTLKAHPYRRLRADPTELDMRFRCSCSLCGGPMGWDGSFVVVEGETLVGMLCTNCSNASWLGREEVREAFRAAPPGFRPGRSSGGV